MFLTKKAFTTILIMTIIYFLIGSIFIFLSILLYGIGEPDVFLFILGIIVYFFAVLVFFWGRYSEGTAKIIKLGNKLVRKELKPAEFIVHYEALKNANDLVINKPNVDVLRVAIIAYDLLDETDKALATVEEMIHMAGKKKTTLAKLIKTSLLFSCGRHQEAELLFCEIQKQKLDIICIGLVDIILKSDRAMAIGDYKVAEAYNLNLLSRPFPKPDNIEKLVAHYTLGRIYEKSQENEKAILHYQYCESFGGETAIKKSSLEKLQFLKH